MASIDMKTHTMALTDVEDRGQRIVERNKANQNTRGYQLSLPRLLALVVLIEPRVVASSPI